MALLDLDHLKNIVGNDPNYLKQVLEIFTRNAPKDMEALANAASNGSHDQVGFYAHKLKSAAGAIGYNTAYEDFKRLEKMAKDIAPLDEIQAFVGTMANDCAACMVDIDRIISEL